MKSVLTAAAAALLLTTAAPARAEVGLIDSLNALTIPLAYVFLCDEKYGPLDPRVLEHLVSAAERRGYVKTNPTQRAYLANETETTIKAWGRAGVARMCLWTKVEMDKTMQMIDASRR